MFVVLLAAGLSSASIMNLLSPELTARLGYAPTHLQDPSEWWRLAVSGTVTTGGRGFVAGVISLLVFTGTSEWWAGTRWAAIGFAVGYFASVLAVSLLVALPLYWLGSSIGKELATLPGVGPSAGYLGSLGLIAAMLPERFRRPGATFAFVVLAALVAIPPIGTDEPRAIWVTDGLVHLFAFVAVFATRMLWQRRRNRRTARGGT